MVSYSISHYGKPTLIYDTCAVYGHAEKEVVQHLEHDFFRHLDNDTVRHFSIELVRHLI